MPSYENEARATLTAVHKVFLQLTSPDARELAPEVAKASPTETKRERALVISQSPVEELLRGHTNPQIREFVNKYVRSLQHRLEDTRDDMEGKRLVRTSWLDAAALSRVDERREGIYNTMQRSPYSPILTSALDTSERELQRVQEVTANLVSLHEYSRRARLTLRVLNTAFTALMEGRLVARPGNEAYSEFLIGCTGSFWSAPKVYLEHFNPLDLYISVVYGDPQRPRLIPLEFAKTQRILPEAVTAVRKQIEQLERLEKEEREQRYWNNQYRDRRNVLTNRQEEKQRLIRAIQNNIAGWTRWHASESDMWELIAGSLKRDMRRFIPLLEYQSVQEVLQPYYTARFASPWKDNVLKPTEMLDYVKQLRKETLSESERIRAAKAKIDRLYKRVGYGRNLPDRYWAELRSRFRIPYFQDFVFEALRKFLERYGEGAIVVLKLLEAAEGYYESPEPRKQYVGDEKYPGFQTLSLPKLVNREPLEILFLLQKLGDVLLRLNCAADCGKYYWVGYDIDPYATESHHKRDFSYAYNSNLAGLRTIEGKTKLAYALERLETREDVRLLRGLVASSALPPCAEWWAASAPLVKTYLIARACDLASYGKALADRTFPQPTIKSVPPQQVAAVLDWLVRLLQETWRRNEEQEEKTWLATAQRRLQQDTEKSRSELAVRNRVRINNQDIYIPDHLPPRVLSAKERGEVREACLKELLHGNEAMYGTAGLKVLEDCVRFCELLHRPENLMQVPSAQYVEREVNTYTTQEMTNQMAQELINLQPHSAYVKSTSWKGKIQTLAVDSVSGAILSAGRRDLVDVRMIARQNAIRLGILKPRSVIEEEIRERQENWRRRGGNEPPPPTSTGGNTPPALPTGSTGNDREPPPTHSIPEKTSETLSTSSPPLLVESLRFFESGKGYPQKSHRHYSTRFPQNTARFVNFELNVRNQLYRQRSHTHHMWVRLYKPDGSLLWEDKDDWGIDIDCEHAWNTWGWGKAQPGQHWTRGIYHVVIFNDGVECAEGSFTITGAEEAPPTHHIPEKAREEKSSSNDDERLVYCSDFNFPDPLWDSSPAHDFRQEEGNFRIFIQGANRLSYHLPKISLTDFRMYVSTTFELDSDEDAHCGVVFRASSDTDKQSFYKFSISRSGSYALSMLNNEGEKSLLEWRFSEFINRDKLTNFLEYILRTKSTNSLMVEMIGQKITLGINGHILTTVTDNKLASGYVGIFVNTVRDFGSHAEVRFQDFRLYAIDRNKPIRKQSQEVDKRAELNAIKYGFWLGDVNPPQELL